MSDSNEIRVRRIPLASFKDRERARQAELKSDGLLFSAAARANRVVRRKGKRHEYSHILPWGLERENLCDAYREDAISVFEQLGIRWHQGTGTTPSGNLCSSQVCAVNFLMPFARNQHLATRLFGPIIPGLEEVVPFEDAAGPLYFTFEWIGRENYLREKARPGATRNRGRHFTSADAALRYRSATGLHAFLIEWKYTESYTRAPLAVADSGTKRTDIYRHVLGSGRPPVAPRYYDDLFVDPFYQLFRQQALAAAMERAGEDGASTVSVLHVAPAANRALRRVTSKALEAFGDDALAVWAGMVEPKERFRSLSTRELLGDVTDNAPQALRGWATYVKRRYALLLQS